MLVEKGQASLGVEQKPLGVNGFGGTTSDACRTPVAALEKPVIHPDIFTGGQVRVECRQAMETPHPLHIGDVVLAVCSESAANSKKLQRDHALGDTIPIWLKGSGEDITRVRVDRCVVHRGYEGVCDPPFP